MSHQSPVRFWIGLLLAAGCLLFATLILRPVFAGHVILNPIAWSIGAMRIHWYGLILAVAIGGAYEWSRRRLITRGIDPAIAERIVWWAAVGGILGARLGFVVQNLGFYLADPRQILAFTQGGLSIHGAVIGGAFGVWLTSRWMSSSSRIPTRRDTDIKDPYNHTWIPDQVRDDTPKSPKIMMPFLFLADVIAPTVLAASILGRFGNLFNYELYGYPTSVVWKMFVPVAHRLPGFESSAFFHPTFLYEALLNLAMLGIILWYEQGARSKERAVDALDSPLPLAPCPLPTGSIFFLTIALYSVSRFIVEFFRIGAPIGWHLTLAQWVSLGIITTSLIVLTRRRGSSYNLNRK